MFLDLFNNPLNSCNRSTNRGLTIGMNDLPSRPYGPTASVDKISLACAKAEKFSGEGGILGKCGTWETGDLTRKLKDRITPHVTNFLRLRLSIEKQEGKRKYKSECSCTVSE